MSKTICIFTNADIGGTFLDWSINYLAGATTFLNADLGIIDLVDNPLDGGIAHKHLKNHPKGLMETVKVINKLLNYNNNYPNTLYADAIWSHEIFKKVSLSGVVDSHVNQEIEEAQRIDYLNICEFCITNQIPVIYLELTSDWLYTRKFRGKSKILLNGDEVEHFLVREKQFSQYFFDSELWSDDTPLWLKREFISLNIRPFTPLKRIINLNSNHIYINALDFWTIGESKMFEIFNKTGIKIDYSRLDNWKIIYHQWSQKQNQLLSFSRNFELICESILKNYYHDLSVYELDLWDEAIIQHALIYRHGLTLKNWQLDKFPNNTQDLHKLLEKNIYHQVEDIYGVLNK